MIRHIPLVVASEKGSTKEHGDALRTRACYVVKNALERVWTVMKF